MATIKSYTDIEQSRKLAEILPIESADMIWVLANPDLPMIRAIAYKDSEKSKYYEVLPAWSLAALLDVLPNIIGDCFKTINCLYGWHCAYMNGNGEIIDNDTEADNPVDACVAMIEKLHGLNLL